MQIALFTTLCLKGPCPADARKATQEKETNFVRKYVRVNTNYTFDTVVWETGYYLLIFVFVVPPAPIGCSSDSECSNTLACDNRNCVSPCLIANPCAPSAICLSKDHKATCECPPGFTGNPYQSCGQS